MMVALLALVVLGDLRYLITIIKLCCDILKLNEPNTTMLRTAGFSLHKNLRIGLFS